MVSKVFSGTVIGIDAWIIEIEVDISVSGGVLYYTVISGGVAADDLLWNPQGESVWSKTVAAWKNAGGEQVAFSDYANATVGTAANISIPKDVLATDVTISADENVTLSGAGKLGGSGSVLKTGAGVLTIDTTGGLEAQPIVVSAGTLRLGDNLTTRALGSSADSSPVVVEKGATLDINYNNAEDNYDPARSSITHDKFIKIAGDGVDGKGAIVSTGSPCYAAFSDVVLTDDATIGGTVRSDFRHSTSHGFTRGTTRNTLTGPGKTLTVKNSAMLALVGTTVDLGSILVPEGGELRIEEASTWKVPGGIRLAGGKLSYYGSGANPGSVNIVAESGDSTISCGGGSPRISGSVTVKEGATLTHTGGTIDYNGGITGAFSQTGGTIGFAGPINDPIDFAGGDMYLNSGVPESGFTLNGTTDAGKVYFRQSGTFSDANITAQTFCVADVANSTVDVTFNNSTFNLYNLYLSWGSKDMANPSSGYLSIGPGTTLTVNKIGIGDDGTSTSNNIKSVMSVDGGTVHLIGTEFYIAHKGPHADFVVNSGTMTVDQATIRLRNSGQALGGYNTSRFIQNGGVFNYGGAGFTANFEDNTEDGQIVLKGGEMNASANWSIPQWISTCFKGGDADGWTLNQADGTTATWTTALQGDGDVTLNGAATLAGNKEVQGAVGGKWTVGDGFTAGLQGAASILGGLSVGDGASAKVNIATGRSAVFTARDFGNIPTNPDGECITNRFNKAIGGTTRGTITHDETFLFTKYNQTDRPFGNLNYQSTYALGQFYVEEGAAGTWSFTGKCDDYVQLWIDGVLVIATTGASNTGTATKELAAGWHSFRHVSIDNSGAFGDAQTIGYKDGSGTMSSYANFSVKNLKMRPAADFGDPGNANTVRWSHFKGNSSTVTANTYKNDDFNWSFCCITNNLGMLARYGKNDARLNNYAVNRFDGWFFVDGEDAGKEWTFRSNYDDRCALWIDGVDTGLDGNEGSTLSCTMVISRGWHRFRIQAADFSGNSGPWGGKGYPVSYQVAGGDQKNFSQENLVFSLCPDGYVQGDVTLASNARLENTAEGAACVYGNIVATGTGAVVAGGFKLDGGTLSFLNVAPDTRDLSTVLAFENPAEDFLADVGAINIDFTARPTRGTVRICAAGGLDAAGAAEKISVSINGEAFTRARCTVEDGFLVAMIPVGTRVIIR